MAGEKLSRTGRKVIGRFKPVHSKAAKNAAQAPQGETRPTLDQQSQHWAEQFKESSDADRKEKILQQL